MNLFSFGFKRLGFFAAGFLLSKALSASSEQGSPERRTAINLVSKGLKLKDSMVYSLSAVRENVEDIVAEARALEETSAGTECTEVCTAVPVPVSAEKDG